jgi:hypothetical protein
MSYGDLKINSNSKFLKIEAGKPHTIRLLTDSPRVEMIHGFGVTKRACSGGALCPQCSDGESAKQRFFTDIWDWELSKRMEWEFGPSIAKQIQKIETALAEEGRTIVETDLKVEAEGSGMDKKYTVTPRLTSKMLPQEATLPY